MYIPVVGIGASAGGLEAFRTLLRHIPVDTGLAFVLIQHLDPTHHSDLTKILSGVSSIPVWEATDGMEIEANHLYIIPPNTALEIADRVFKITPRAPIHSGPHLPIDQFLKSLAQEYGSRAIGVLLSGAGSDGTAGFEALKAAGGVTLAQDPATAGFASMPRTAIARECVDFVGAPEAIAAELTKLAHHAYIATDEGTPSPETGDDQEEQFDSILAIVRAATGIDFGLYRETTIRRRIMRRLALCNIGSLEEYIERIRNDSEELNALHRDLLINVTRFFRDPESFENLKTLIFPRFTQNRAPDSAIRIWVPGCATGEEAYSIAIVLQEYFEETGNLYPVQIFGSDVSAEVIEKARSGRYTRTITADVSQERLKRFFSVDRGDYTISQHLRDMCVFSTHDLLRDPPFSKLDLISCRNTLIFFGSARQYVVARFHYALKPGGFLVLDPTKMDPGTLFSAVAGMPGVFLKNETAATGHPSVAVPPSIRKTAPANKRPINQTVANRADSGRELERAFIARYRGAGIIVNPKLEVLEILGDATPYITLQPGKVTFNLLRLLPEPELFLEIEKLVREAAANGQVTSRLPYTRSETPDGLNLEVVPLGTAETRSFLVLFEPAPEHEAMANSEPRDRELARLKQDLANARLRLTTMIAEQQQADEEGQSAILSSNEELHSLNEELETAKEELQSINEELITVNQELLSNIAALTVARDFAMSIIETATSPLLVLTAELRIESANKSFYRMFHLSSHEVEGQLLWSISKGCWNIPRVREMLEAILPQRKTVQDLEIQQDFPGSGYKLLVLSARQLDSVQKVLLGIEDVTQLRRRADARLRESEERFANVADAAPVLIWVAGPDKGCTFFNKSWLEFTGRPLEQELGNGWAAGVHPDDLDSCLNAYTSSFDARRTFQVEYRLRRADGEYRWLLDHGVPRIDTAGVFLGYIGSCIDITEFKNKMEEDLTRQKLETVGQLAEGIVHDFNNLLGGILANAELALAGLDTGSKPAEELHRIRDAGLRGAEIARQLMIYAGREEEVLEAVSISGIVEDMIDLLKVSVSKHATLETSFGKDLPLVRTDPSQIRQLVMNLISNASEAIGDRDGTIRVATRKVTVEPGASVREADRLPAGDYVQVEVTDTGRGMTPEVRARIFDPFFTTKSTGSHGHGLMVVQRIVERLHGAVRVSSAPGKGSSFLIYLPADTVTAPAVDPVSGFGNDAVRSPRATILIIEDEELLRHAVAKILQRHGYSVIEASDGTAGLDMMRAHESEIDLLLLDVTLPGASSQQIYEESRRLKADLPVIVISAKSKETAGASLTTGIDHFLRKPFLSMDLVDMIEQLLSSRASTAKAGDGFRNS